MPLPEEMQWIVHVTQFIKLLHCVGVMAALVCEGRRVVGVADSIVTVYSALASECAFACWHVCQSAVLVCTSYMVADGVHVCGDAE